MVPFRTGRARAALRNGEGRQNAEVQQARGEASEFSREAFSALTPPAHLCHFIPARSAQISPPVPVRSPVASYSNFLFLGDKIVRIGDELQEFHLAVLGQRHHYTIEAELKIRSPAFHHGDCDLKSFNRK